MHAFTRHHIHIYTRRFGFPVRYVTIIYFLTCAWIDLVYISIIFSWIYISIKHGGAGSGRLDLAFSVKHFDLLLLHITYIGTYTNAGFPPIIRYTFISLC